MVYDLNRILVPQAPPGYADDTGDTHFVPAPCQAACPVGTDAPSYIGYIWEGQFEQAFEAITSTNPFSSIFWTNSSFYETSKLITWYIQSIS